MSTINLGLELAEARTIGRGLRDAAAACGPSQSVLRARLVVAAEKLDQLAGLTTRALDRIEELEQQLGTKADSQLGADTVGRPPASPIAPAIVAGVDVAPLATAASIVGIVETASPEEWTTDGAELRASLRMARAVVLEVFTDLLAASARGAS